MRKNLLFVALVALSLVACDKKESVENTDNLPRSIVLKIDNAKAARAAVDWTDQIAASSKAALTELKVFFHDGTTILDARVISDLTKITGGTGEVFHNLSPQITQVTIVGNRNTALAAITTGSTVASLYAYDVAISGEQDNARLTLFGEALTLTEIPNPETVLGDDAQHLPQNKYYKAEISLAPVVGRVEITGFACTDLNPARFYREVTINGLAMDNIMLSKALKNGAESFTINCTVDPVTGAVDYAKAFEAEASGLAPYAVTQDDDAALVLTQAATSYTPTGNKALAWNFIPSVNIDFAGKTPAIVLKATAVGDGVVTPDTGVRYLSTKGFKDANGSTTAIQMEANKVYRFRFDFLQEDLTVTGAKCIQVTVTQAEWTVVPVTPIL